MREVERRRRGEVRRNLHSGEHFRRRSAPSFQEFEGVWEDLNLGQARRIARAILAPFLSGEVDAIYLIYNEFKSAMTQQVIARPLLPLAEMSAAPAEAEHDGEPSPEYIFEPNKASIFERTWALPTLEFHGIKGGFIGDGAKTVIPAQATAKVSLRLVPGLERDKVFRWLEKAVAKLAPRWADVTVTMLHGGDPVEVDTSAPAFGVLDQAFEEVTGRKAVHVRAGGSIPIVPELGLTGAPVILTGIGLPDDGLHSPNEKLDLRQLSDGVKIFARFFELMGAEAGEG